ncbi:hypothetical protein [Streptomyces sp. NEAU-NA10]|uniref:hypothetical protein n=1 Tax=Streptomyces sp. NEAU-NA10 TaxID=3416050 RepID=UPI003CC6761F
MQSVIERLEAVQYDGTNGDYIASTFLSNTTLDSDDGQLLQLVDGMQDPRIPLGSWVIRRTAGVGLFLFAGAFTDADYRAKYTVLP